MVPAKMKENFLEAASPSRGLLPSAHSIPKGKPSRHFAFGIPGTAMPSHETLSDGEIS